MDDGDYNFIELLKSLSPDLINNKLKRKVLRNIKINYKETYDCNE